MRKIILFSLFCLALCGQHLKAQTEQPKKVMWYTLTSVPLDGSWKPNEEPPLPLFTDELRKIEGKLVQVEGYAIPLDPSGNQITLSANPFSACFFCGKAGPASIMTVLFEKPQKGLRTDDYIHLTGRMRFNAFDPSQPYYTLEHAQLLPKK
jgi:hypothetical protein